MTTAERDAILNPPEGLLIYNTTLNALNLYTGVAAGWIILGTFQVDLFYVRGPDYTSTGCPGAPNPYPWTETPVFPYCVYRGTAWTAMRRMSIPNVQLSQGDLIRLTFFGDYMGRFEPGSNITGPYSQLRYVFDNGTTRTPYGPYMNVGAYEDEPLPASVFQFGYPYLAILRCGTGAGEVPPGTYTIDLEVLPDPILVDSATERSRGALAVARNGDYYLCVERIR